jgi:hypothetical protein
MLDELLGRVLDEGQVIRHTPIAFSSAFLFAAVLIFLAVEYHFNGVVGEQQATIENLKQHVEDYRAEVDRYRALQPARTKFDDMSNAKLASAVHEIVPQLNAFHAKWERLDRALQDRHAAEEQAILPVPPHPSLTVEEQQQINKKYGESFQKYTEAESTLHTEEKVEYETTFKDSAILLREELFARLPHDVGSKLVTLNAQYAMGWTTDKVAADLDTLARLLPPDTLAKPSPPQFTTRDAIGRYRFGIFNPRYHKCAIWPSLTSQDYDDS